jgi:hypothetical protein
MNTYLARKKPRLLRQRAKRFLVVTILNIGLLAACSSIQAEGTPESFKGFLGPTKLSIIPTGMEIVSGFTYNWCDNDHLFVRTDNRLYLVDVNDLSRQVIEFVDEEQRRLLPFTPHAGACRDGKIFLSKTNKATKPADDPRKKISDIYIGSMSGGQAERLVAPTESMLAANMRSKYILAQKPKLKTADGYKTDAECATYHHPDYKLLCIDTDARPVTDRFYALERFILAPYRWNEAVVVRGSDGMPQPARNVRPPVLDKSGRPIYLAIELRDLEFNLIVKLIEDPVFKSDTLNLTVGPDEQFAYVPCARRANSQPEGHLDFYAVCRYRLDGKQNQWEQVFYADELRAKTRMHIQRIEVAANGDVYFAPLGRPPHNGIWKYDKTSGKVLQVTHNAPYNGDDAPKVSPDGKKIAFMRSPDKSYLFIAQRETK